MHSRCLYVNASFYYWSKPIIQGRNQKFIGTVFSPIHFLQGSYYFAEFIFPDFSLSFPDKMNNYSLTNFFICDTSKTILSTQM